LLRLARLQRPISTIAALRAGKITGGTVAAAISAAACLLMYPPWPRLCGSRHCYHLSNGNHRPATTKYILYIFFSVIRVTKSEILIL